MTREQILQAAYNRGFEKGAQEAAPAWLDAPPDSGTQPITAMSARQNYLRGEANRLGALQEHYGSRVGGVPTGVRPTFWGETRKRYDAPHAQHSDGRPDRLGQLKSLGMRQDLPFRIWGQDRPKGALSAFGQLVKDYEAGRQTSSPRETLERIRSGERNSRPHSERAIQRLLRLINNGVLQARTRPSGVAGEVRAGRV